LPTKWSATTEKTKQKSSGSNLSVFSPFWGFFALERNFSQKTLENAFKGQINGK